MTIETTILDFQLSNTYEDYESHMNAKEQQKMFKEMGVKTFYIGKSLDCLLYTSPSPRDGLLSRMPSSA